MDNQQHISKISLPWQAYHQATRSATYGFLSALPLILIYEIMIILVNQGAASQVRVGAEVWVKQALALFGGTGFYFMGVAVLAIGLAVFVAERNRRPPLRLRYFGWMLAESAFYAVVVALLVAGLVGAIFAMAAAGSPGRLGGLGMELALSIGAGLYEELVFRVILVGGLYGLLQLLVPGQRSAYVVAAVLGALLFSAVHYIGALGDAFTLASFLFRFFFGLALNVIFLLRGFGVAAWTHALYDVMVVTLNH